MKKMENNSVFGTSQESSSRAGGKMKYAYIELFEQELDEAYDMSLEYRLYKLEDDSWNYP